MLVSGVRWVLSAIRDAAMAEMNDVATLRAALVEATVRLEAGEICEEEYVQAEEELLARIPEVRARNEAVAGPIAFPGAGSQDATMEVDAAVVGDFHAAPPRAPRRRKAAKREQP